ncbi:MULTISPECIES: glycosyltransferase family 4 protein [unclassified Streptomyces]|uniref:glycosyltransferase family 4 protein n=1 Tax=unclassified Streptomyces TaxID=2593676 RepID=UPI001F04CB29|nr:MULTISPECIES: glycosyltransferase family 4 protein [unclassified Streptomyces]MCH0565466.1 glycosyltransferase family 4 protein [Streptomyces sp. MUM 2J]MCH0568165.1 glycosyltransferase family 4 protein [Streptomyces sp. MUM 136J]
MKISFIVSNLCHIGGVVSATQNLAGALAEKHDVEIVCLRKSRDASYFPLDPRVKVTVLTDLRGNSPASDLDNPLIQEFPKVYVFPPKEREGRPWISRLAELRLLEWLETTDADAVVSSSPRITIMLSHARKDYLRLAQEHSMPAIYAEWEKKPLFRTYHDLDAITALTPEEVASLGKLVPGVRNRLEVMPNCVPASTHRSTGDNKVIIAAGLLKENKNFAMAVEAFAPVVARHPGWKLRIYGTGAEKANLRKQIEKLGLYNDVLLMGPATPVSPEFAKGSVFLMPSRREAFGNVIVEAMAAGLPVISTDADHGPRNIIADGEDGFVVPKDDVAAMTAAMMTLVEDDERRRSMGRAAVRNAERFHETGSRERFEAILERALARRRLPHTATAVVQGDGSVLIAVERMPVDLGEVDIICRRPCQDDEERRFPLSPAGEALVPWHDGLSEGEWEVSVGTADGLEVPLTTDGFGVDTRDLLTVELPRPGDGPALEWLLPYRQDDGRLRVRSRVRDRHAEVAGLTVDGFTLVVDAALWGAAPNGTVIEATRRGKVPATVTFDTQPGSGGALVARLDSKRLIGDHKGKETIWDVWLRPAPGADRLPLSKLATDVLKPIDVYTYPRPVLKPAVAARPSPLGRQLRRVKRKVTGTAAPKPPKGVEVRPYFNSAAQLSVKTVTV